MRFAPLPATTWARCGSPWFFDVTTALIYWLLMRRIQ
jgi:hypothetical protein